MTRIELEYSRNYPEEVNVFLLNAPEVENYLVEQHGYLRTKFGGVATLGLAFLYRGADFIGDRSGDFLSVTIEHDLSEVMGQRVFKAIAPNLETFQGLLEYDARSRIPAPTKIEPVDHRPNPCAWDGEAPCEEWGGLAFHGKRYCDKHALAPAMHELIELRSRAMTAKQAWAAGAEWAIDQVERKRWEDGDVQIVMEDLARRLTRDMKLANPHRLPSTS